MCVCDCVTFVNNNIIIDFIMNIFFYDKIYKIRAFKTLILENVIQLIKDYLFYRYLFYLISVI